jgi:hypothetical protein
MGEPYKLDYAPPDPDYRGTARRIASIILILVSVAWGIYAVWYAVEQFPNSKDAPLFAIALPLLLFNVAVRVWPHTKNH